MSDTSIEVSFQAPEYLKNYQECRQLGIYADVSAHCIHANSSDLTIFSAHGLLLSSSSPYLNLLLESSFKEKPSNLQSFPKGSLRILQQNMLFPFDPCCNFSKIDNSIQFCLESCCNFETQFCYNERKFGNFRKYGPMHSVDQYYTHKFVSLKSFLSNSKDVVLIMKGLDPVYFKYVLCSIYNENFSIEKNHIWKFLNFMKRLELSSYELVKEKIMNIISNLNNRDIDTNLFQNKNPSDTLKFHSMKKLSASSEHDFNINENTQNDSNLRNCIGNFKKYIEKEELASHHHANIVPNDKLSYSIPSRDSYQTYCKYLQNETMVNTVGSCNHVGYCYDKEQREWLNFHNLASKLNNFNNTDKNLSEPINDLIDCSTLENCYCTYMPIREGVEVLHSMKCNLQPEVISSSVKNHNFKIANLLGENLRNSSDNYFRCNLYRPINFHNSGIEDFRLIPSNVNGLIRNTSGLAASQTVYDATSVYAPVPFPLNSRNSAVPLTVTNCSTNTQHLKFSNEMIITNEYSNKVHCNEDQIKMSPLVEHVSVTLSGSAEKNTSSHYSKESNRIVLEHETKIYLHDGGIQTTVLSNDSNKSVSLQCMDSIIARPHLTDLDSATSKDSLNDTEDLVMVSNTDKEFNSVSCNQMMGEEYVTKTNKIRCKKIKINSHRSDKNFFQKPKRNFMDNTSSSNSEENIPLKSITSIRVVSFRSMKSLRNKGSVANKGINVKSKYNNVKGSKRYFEKGCQGYLPIALKKARKDTRKSSIDTSDASLENKIGSKSPDFFEVHEAEKIYFKQNFKKVETYSVSVQSITNENNDIACSKTEIANDCKVNAKGDSGFSLSSDEYLLKAGKKQICNRNTNSSTETVLSCIICTFKSSSLIEMFEHVKSNHYNGIIKHAKCFDKKCPIKHIPYDSGEHIKHHIVKFQHMCTKCSFSSRSLKGIRVHIYAHKKHEVLNKEDGLCNSNKRLRTSKQIICSSGRSTKISLEVPATHSDNNKKGSSLHDIGVGGTLATSIIGRLCCGIVKKYKKFPNQYKLCLEKAITSELSSSLSSGLRKVKPPLSLSANLLKTESKKTLLKSDDKKFPIFKTDSAQLNASRNIFKNKLEIMKNDLKQPYINSKILSMKKDTIKLNVNKKSEPSDASKSIVKEEFAFQRMEMSKMKTSETNKDENIIKFNCLLCEDTFNGSCDLANHFFAKHRVSLPLICPFKDCHVKITCAAQLRNHALRHTRKAKFDCSTCSYSCPTKNGISIHSKMHKVRTAETSSRQH